MIVTFLELFKGEDLIAIDFPLPPPSSFIAAFPMIYLLQVF